MCTAAPFIILPKWKQPRCPIQWANKANVAYPYHGTLLFGHKKQWSTNTSYNMDEPGKPCATWKKPVSHRRSPITPFIVGVQRDESIETEVESWLPSEADSWFLAAAMKRGHEKGFFLGVIKMFWKRLWQGWKNSEYTQICWIVHFKWANYTCELYFNKAVRKQNLLW